MLIDESKYTALVQATRYLHAMHDIEIKLADDNSIAKLQALTLMLDDPTLSDYWQTFLHQLNIKHTTSTPHNTN